MKFSAIASTAAVAMTALAAVVPDVSSSNVVARDEVKEEVTELIDNIKADFLADLDAQANVQARAGKPAPKCTSKNIRFRKEYGAMTRNEKLSYIKAVKCLQKLPARTPASVAAGAKSRYDDFIVTHIQQTLTAHYTGNFMAWHRWYLHLYETALRDECGYIGMQPYWDWPRYANAPQKAPFFDGSDTSLGGNGDYVPHNGTWILPPPGVANPPIYLEPGLGGGYVTTGPFANMIVNLGPVGGYEGAAPGPDGGLGYNPRRMKRDVGPWTNQRFANYTTVFDMLKSRNIDEFRFVNEGVGSTGEIGPHGGIHYTINGDPGGDLWTAPGDPSFYIHHANMDRMWSYWQLLDPSTRYKDLGSDIYAHKTWQNAPPSPFTSLDDVIEMGYTGPSTTIREMMSTTGGPLCYFYL